MDFDHFDRFSIESSILALSLMILTATILSLCTAFDGVCSCESATCVHDLCVCVGVLLGLCAREGKFMTWCMHSVSILLILAAVALVRISLRIFVVSGASLFGSFGSVISVQIAG